jgi:hypothetical protein
LWHGLAGIFALIGWLLFDKGYIIGEPNTAFWYYAGFVFFWTTVGIEGVVKRSGPYPRDEAPFNLTVRS